MTWNAVSHEGCNGTMSLRADMKYTCYADFLDRPLFVHVGLCRYYMDLSMERFTLLRFVSLVAGMELASVSFGAWHGAE